ncbi:MAG: TonB-dependent receptor [Ignavibacteria bacterium]
MIKFIIVLLFCVYSIPAQEIISSGQDSIFMGEILVESNRLKMKNSEAPNKIQVMDEHFILSINGNSLPDALKLGDAVYIKDYGFNSGSKTISLNATQSEHTLILLNGVRLNSRQNAQVDLSLYNLDNVSRIEVSKGGSSALYGSEAIGGVINIITKNFVPLHSFGISLKGGVGSYGQRKFYGRFSHSFDMSFLNNVNYSLSFSDERAKNNFDYNFKNGPNILLMERENSDFNTQAMNFELSFTDGDESAYKLFANYSHFERGVPGVDLGYTSGTARQIDYNFTSSFSYDRKVDDDIYMNTDISYNYQLEKYFDPSTFNLSTPINSYYRLSSFAATNVLSYLPNDKFSIEAGSELSFNYIESNETEDGDLTQGALFVVSKLEANFKKGSKITFYPSVRYDYFSNISEKNVITGKFGINIKPFGKIELNLKSSIGNNFSAPTFNELYWKDIGNKDLKPEKSISFDAGLYHQFKVFGVNEFEASYFNINTTDRIIWTPVSGAVWRPINIGKVKSEGIDLSLRSNIALSKRLSTSASINYTYSSAMKKNIDFAGDPTYGKQLIYLPKEMVKASIMMNYLTTSKLLKSVSFSLFYNFSTKRYTNFENSQFVPRYDAIDGNLGLSFTKGEFEIGTKFIVNNIFNEDYSVLPGYPMPLRNYKFELSIKY